MVRPDLAARKIARAASWLEEAEARVAKPVEEFLADVPGRDLASFYLFLAIEEGIGLAAHWVADAGWPPADDAASTFDLLADRRAIARDLADRLRAAVGLRNRIAHGYATIDPARVHAEFSDGLETLRRFLAAAASAARL
jgi:uncharacterized protein YutE (UPF0331/DUF86 family)